ncbi:MAG: helix-turn-helix domain-containing protein [Phycisphaerales bacterium]
MKSNLVRINELPEELVAFNRERVKNHLSQAIFELMEGHGLSRTEFAALLGKGKSRVTQLLSGCENLSADTLADILLIFGRTPYLTLGVDPYEIRFPVDEADKRAPVASSTSFNFVQRVQAMTPQTRVARFVPSASEEPAVFSMTGT